MIAGISTQILASQCFCFNFASDSIKQIELFNTKYKFSIKTMAKKDAQAPKYSKETYRFWYESTQLQRKFEEKCGQLYGMQKIKGFCHLYIGQEACSSGSKSALIEGDKYITAYRDHGIPLALGTSPNAIMAEFVTTNPEWCSDHLLVIMHEILHLAAELKKKKPTSTLPTG